jgi:bifunctional protein TilS/HprT
MLTIDLDKFPKSGKYIIGVSGGPDSMCLLFTLVKLGYDVVACNVNYNTRDVSAKEQEMVKEFCLKNHVLVETLSVKHNKLDRNFEGWARITRYNFFKKVYDKYNANGLFIAHHKNDDLETYIMQRNRNNIVRRFGIAERTVLLGMRVLRPFLNYTKNELLQECIKENIPYSIDVTNLQPIHERNRVRLDIMNKYTKEEVEDFFKQKDLANQKIEAQMKKISPLLTKSEWELKDLSSLSQIECIRFLYEIIVRKISHLANRLSRKRLEDYLKTLMNNKSNLYITIDDDNAICKSYGSFKLISTETDVDYEYVLNEPGKMDNEYFSFDMPSDTAFLKIYKESYPLTIRNAKGNDVVTFGNVRKKVNRIMIDEKIPLYKRNTYPIILDKDKKVVYFPLYNSEAQKSIATKLCFVVK